MPGWLAQMEADVSLGQRRSDKRISTYATQPGCLAEERLMPGRSDWLPIGTAAAELSCGRSASTNSAASKKASELTSAAQPGSVSLS